MKTIVVIGERAHLPDADAGDIALWLKRWRSNTIKAMHQAPTMTTGPTRDRLLDLTSLRRGEFLLINLLPPHKELGLWNTDLAELSAMRLLTWMQTPDCRWEKVILLGKRVSQELVDRMDIKFGTIYDLVGTPALCYPHPSGESPYLNEDSYRERAREWARKFLRRSE